MPDVFTLPDHIPPRLARRTTYSSLPPSPQYGPVDFGVKRPDSAVDKLASLDTALDELNERNLPSTTTEHVDSRLGGTPHHFERHVELQKPVPEPRTTWTETPEPTLGHKARAAGSSLWDVLTDDDGQEDWEGWIIDGKWCAL